MHCTGPLFLWGVWTPACKTHAMEHEPNLRTRETKSTMSYCHIISDMKASIPDFQ